MNEFCSHSRVLPYLSRHLLGEFSATFAGKVDIPPTDKMIAGESLADGMEILNGEVVSLHHPAGDGVGLGA